MGFIRVAAALVCITVVSGFSTSPALPKLTLSRQAEINSRCLNAQVFSLRHGHMGLKMTVDSQMTKEAEKKAEASTPANLCDVNSQLCDGDIHTVPLDLDIQTQSKPEKENLMAKISVPAALIAYQQTTGEWPNFSNPEATAKVSAVIFGFLNVARALVPVRIGLTLATVPLVDKFIVQPLNLGNKDKDVKPQ